MIHLATLHAAARSCHSFLHLRGPTGCGNVAGSLPRASGSRKSQAPYPMDPRIHCSECTERVQFGGNLYLQKGGTWIHRDMLDGNFIQKILDQKYLSTSLGDMGMLCLVEIVQEMHYSNC